MVGINDKWDTFFLGLAEFVSKASKDPSTKVGAVIIDENRRVISVGYNGFPKGVNDDKERYANRDLKLRMILHAEANAMLFAKRDLTNCVLYTWPFQPCPRCAAMIIQTGIKRCVAPVCPEHLLERWTAEFQIANLMFGEAGVKLELV